MKNAKTRNAYKIWVVNFEGRGKKWHKWGRKTLMTKYVAQLRIGHCEVLYTGSGYSGLGSLGALAQCHWRLVRVMVALMGVWR
jgi:hypothetical protein